MVVPWRGSLPVDADVDHPNETCLRPLGSNDLPPFLIVDRVRDSYYGLLFSLIIYFQLRKPLRNSQFLQFYRTIEFIYFKMFKSCLYAI
jgi:hypothetical protein